MIRDAWRLAVGTFTALPVTPPARVERAEARGAMLLAPLAVLPLGVAAGLVVWGARHLELSPYVVPLLVIAVLALGSRAFHLDGLADTADGLTASYDRERSLEVMRSGSVGPAGAVALILVLGMQAGAMLGLLHLTLAPVLIGTLVCVSRVALLIGCAGGVPSARPSGLGATVAGTVPHLWLGAGAVLAAGLVSGVGAWAGLEWWRGALAVLLAGLAVGVLVRRCVQRFGGITGDVLGASIELALLVLLIALG